MFNVVSVITICVISPTNIFNSAFNWKSLHQKYLKTNQNHLKTNQNNLRTNQNHLKTNQNVLKSGFCDYHKWSKVFYPRKDELAESATRVDTCAKGKSTAYNQNHQEYEEKKTS